MIETVFSLVMGGILVMACLLGLVVRALAWAFRCDHEGHAGIGGKDSGDA